MRSRPLSSLSPPRYWCIPSFSPVLPLEKYPLEVMYRTVHVMYSQIPNGSNHNKSHWCWWYVVIPLYLITVPRRHEEDKEKRIQFMCRRRDHDHPNNSGCCYCYCLLHCFADCCPSAQFCVRACASVESGQRIRINQRVHWFLAISKWWAMGDEFVCVSYVIKIWRLEKKKVQEKGCGVANRKGKRSQWKQEHATKKRGGWIW